MNEPQPPQSLFAAARIATRAWELPGLCHAEHDERAYSLFDALHASYGDIDQATAAIDELVTAVVWSIWRADCATNHKTEADMLAATNNTTRPAPLLDKVRVWLRDLMVGGGAKIIGARAGDGSTTLEIEAEGQRFAVCIRPMSK